MTRTLPLGNSQEEEEENKGSKFKPCQQEEHRFWFWLKGIVRWDLRLAQPHRFWFWLKGIADWNLRLAQPYRFWFWLKGIAKWDLRLAQPRLSKSRFDS
jgi:hypothetical protein